MKNLNVNVDNKWKILRKIKRETPLNKVCNLNGVFVDADISSIVKDVEIQLKIKSSYLIFENMTIWDLQTAAEMFLYLYTCPGVTSQENWFINWFTFYNNLFKTSPDMILLTLNRMMQSTNDNDFKGKLFKRVARLLHLKYESIQSLLPEDTKNSRINGSLKTFDNLTLNLKGIC